MSDTYDTRATGRYKVERVADRYDLSSLPAQLARQWMGEGVAETSLRDLAHQFNRAVLREAFARAGQTPIEPEIETMYAVLSKIDGSSADRTKLRRELKRDGVDVEQLEADFLTHQAIHTYLTKGLGLSKSTDDTDPIERAKETIDKLRSRTTAVSTSELDRLSRADALSIGDADILVQITVNCRDCGTYGNILDVLDDGGCECSSNPPTT